jgi:hypothetical protein
LQSLKDVGPEDLIYAWLLKQLSRESRPFTAFTIEPSTGRRIPARGKPASEMVLEDRR